MRYNTEFNNKHIRRLKPNTLCAIYFVRLSTVMNYDLTVFVWKNKIKDGAVITIKHSFEL